MKGSRNLEKEKKIYLDYRKLGFEENIMGTILIIGGPGTGKTRFIFRYLKEFQKILWVTTIRSAEDVRREIENEVGERDLWIVDTHTWQRREGHTEKDIIIGNPLNLNEVSLGIGKALNALKSDYLLAFDSISGLLLYHPPQKIIHLLRNTVVRIEGDGGSGIFTLVEQAHDIHTEISVSLIFNNIIYLERQFEFNKARRLIKIIKASEYIEPDVAEFKIARDGIELPRSIDEFVAKQLRLK